MLHIRKLDNIKKTTVFRYLSELAEAGIIERNR